MAYAIGVAAAIVQMFAFQWIAQRFPLPLAILGYLTAGILLYAGVTTFRNPYAGEVNAVIGGAIVLGAFYLLLSALIQGSPFWRSFGLAGFGVAMVYPINCVIVWVRDSSSRSMNDNPEKQRLWQEACGHTALAFSLIWLALVLLAPLFLRIMTARQAGPSAPVT